MIVAVLLCIGLVAAQDTLDTSSDRPILGQSMNQDEINALPQAGSQDVAIIASSAYSSMKLICTQLVGVKDCQTLRWAKNGMREDWGKAQNWSDKKCNVEINLPTLAENRYTSCYGVNVFIVGEMPVVEKVEKKMWRGNKIRCIRPELAEDSTLVARSYKSQSNGLHTEVYGYFVGKVKMFIIDEIEIEGDMEFSCNNTKKFSVKGQYMPELIIDYKSKKIECTVSDLTSNCTVDVMIGGKKVISGPPPLSYKFSKISVTDIGCEGRCEADGDIVHLPTTGQVVNKPIFTAIIIIIILIILIIIILILLFMWFKCGFKERYGYKINMDFKKRFNFGDKFSTYRLSGVDADGKVPPEEEDSEDQEEYEDEKGSVMTGTEASFNVKPNLNSHNQKKDWRSKEDIDHISNATSSASNRAPMLNQNLRVQSQEAASFKDSLESMYKKTQL